MFWNNIEFSSLPVKKLYTYNMVFTLEGCYEYPPVPMLRIRLHLHRGRGTDPNKVNSLLHYQ